MVSPTRTPTRKPLHQRSDSEKNIAAVRLVPATPPQLLWSNTNDSIRDRDSIYGRTPFPTHPSHILTPGYPSTGSGAYLQESAAALTQSDCRVSAEQLPTKQLTQPGPGTSTTHQPHQTTPASRQSSTSSSRPSSSRSLPRKRKHVKVNPDKTFSVLEIVQRDEATDLNDGAKVPPSEPRQLVLDQPPPATENADPAISASPAPTAQEKIAPQATRVPDTPDPLSKSSGIQDNTVDSPWNYKLVGGLRKVPKTPDLKGKNTLTLDSSPPPLPELTEEPKVEQELTSKTSFHSTWTVSTDYSNYEVFGSSPPTTNPPQDDSNYQVFPSSSPQPYTDEDTVLHHPPPSSGSSNYEILGQSSPAGSELQLYNPSSNYELHGESSPVGSTISLPLQARSKYSRESLVIPPLQPRAQRSTEKFGYYKSRSRESLRTGSLTSISSVISQDFVQAIAAGKQLTRVPSNKHISISNTWVNPLALHAVKSHMQAHPHQWSSQLSTVASVSDGGTDRGSRAWSENARRSSGFASHHRQMASISSSMQRDEDDSLEWPQSAHLRERGRDTAVRMVEDQDEHGDGITDMIQGLNPRPSRTRLSGFYSIASSEVARTNTMRSISSSRANSLLGNTIPAWAKLYYGSGERKFLAAPGSSIEGTDSRANSFRSGSPDTSNFPLSIYSPRRRPREGNPTTTRISHGSMDITPVVDHGRGDPIIEEGFKRKWRRPTSSVWSPHLQIDKRMTRRKSVWESPSVDWSQSGFSSRRNIQVVMFIFGFVMPLGKFHSIKFSSRSELMTFSAWMVAAFLPLPPKPIFSMRERSSRASHFDMSEDMSKLFGPMDEKRYESARWWRLLNRVFSFVGIAIIILVVSCPPLPS
jgi:hypothetical protein